MITHRQALEAIKVLGEYCDTHNCYDGTVINADLNGAANILRKSKQNFDFEELCRGLLASPQRIRLL